MRVLIDLDGVVADWGGGYNDLAGGFGLLDTGAPLYEQRTGWNLNEGLNEHQRALTKRIMEEPGFYRYLKVIPGAQDAIAMLAQQGHDLWFVTTPFLTNPTCASDKLAWVAEHFPFMHRRTILTMDKTLIDGAFLIDDKPVIEGENEQPTWTHLCFGEYGYSTQTHSWRVRTWPDALEALEALA